MHCARRRRADAHRVPLWPERLHFRHSCQPARLARPEARPSPRDPGRRDSDCSVFCGKVRGVGRFEQLDVAWEPNFENMPAGADGSKPRRVPLPVFQKVKVPAKKRAHNHYSLFRMFCCVGAEWCTGTPARAPCCFVSSRARGEPGAVGSDCRRPELVAGQRRRQAVPARAEAAVAVTHQGVSL